MMNEWIVKTRAIFLCVCKKRMKKKRESWEMRFFFVFLLLPLPSLYRTWWAWWYKEEEIQTFMRLNEEMSCRIFTQKKEGKFMKVCKHKRKSFCYSTVLLAFSLYVVAFVCLLCFMLCYEICWGHEGSLWIRKFVWFFVFSGIAMQHDSYYWGW